MTEQRLQSIGKRAWRRFRRLPAKAQAAAWITIAIIVVVLPNLGSPDDGGKTTDASASQHASCPASICNPKIPESALPPATVATVRAGEIASKVEAALGDKVDKTRLPRVRDVTCSARRLCVVSYNANTPFWKAEKTLLEEARPIWKALFADSRLKEATIIPWSVVTTAGGKDKRVPVMKVTCDRSANREIDWDKVDSHGIESLCDYLPMVKF